MRRRGFLGAIAAFIVAPKAKLSPIRHFAFKVNSSSLVTKDGLTIRTEVIKHRPGQFTVDVLYGVRTIRPELAYKFE